MAKSKMYDVSSTDAFIADLCKKGWEGIQLNEGSLGCGDWVLIAPTERYWNYIIKEVYVSAWQSAQTIRRCRDISKSMQKKIDKVLAL